ncbi:MAG: hypothetical protein FJX06_14320 [Alphaproteobacteria bacterium]|nr:hypothetical protein [Alphaproteobacteria bacterium]
MTGHEVKSASKADVQVRSDRRRRELLLMRPAPRAAFCIVAFLLLMSVAGGGSIAETPTPAAQVKSVAFLNVQFLNDHEGQEPTTDAERARLVSIEELFKSKLEASGSYRRFLVMA